MPAFLSETVKSTSLEGAGNKRFSAQVSSSVMSAPLPRMAVLRAWSFPVGSSGRNSASVIFRPTSSAEQFPVDSEYLPALVTYGMPGLQSCIVTHSGPWAL